MNAIEHPIAEFASMVLRICAFAGTGNVLEVQALLHKCAEHPNAEKDEEATGSEEAKTKAAAEEESAEEAQEKAKQAGFVQVRRVPCGGCCGRAPHAWESADFTRALVAPVRSLRLSLASHW